jgi:type IV pilus assembly protein PilM
MFTKPTALHTIGLDFDKAHIRVAQLSQSRGKPVLDQVFEINISSHDPNSDDVNPLYNDVNGKIIKENSDSHIVVTTLASDEVIVRPLELKLKKESDIDSVLAFQAEPLLPYPVENAILDRMIVAKSNENTQLSLIAARKDHIMQHLEKWDILQIVPEVISCAPIALAFFAKHFSPSENTQFVLNLNKSETTCILVNNGNLLASQSSHNGLTDLIEAFSEDHPNASKEQFANLDFSNISKTNHAKLFTALENWRLDITRLLYSLSKQLKEDIPVNVLITGDGAAMINLGTTLCQTAQKQIIVPIESPQFALPLADLQSYAVAIGAALSALPNAKNQINFRQNELAFPNPWRRLKMPLFMYFAGCVFLAAAIYIFGIAYSGYKDDQLRREYLELLTSMNRSYEKVEKEYASKMHIRLPNNEVPKVAELSTEDLSNRMQFLQKDLKEGPNDFPFNPNIPRISDVLAWLSNHPNVSIGKDSAGTAISPLQIDHVTYTLIKRPEIKKPQEKYQAKVEIEFSTPTPKLAREFHDALIAPNDLVDPKGEIKWNTSKNKYKTSFFLKDKTVYSSSVKSGA